MPKTTSAKINKSQEIRNTIKGGVRMPKDVQAKLAERGIKVSTQMISTVKGKMKARKARTISRHRAAEGNGAPATNIKSLARFIAAVQTVGGPREARKILQEMGA